MMRVRHGGGEGQLLLPRLSIPDRMPSDDISPALRLLSMGGEILVVCGSEGTSGRGSRVGQRVRVVAEVVVHVQQAEVEQRQHVVTW